MEEEDGGTSDEYMEGGMAEGRSIEKEKEQSKRRKSA